jgi:hypothetical protein
MLPKEVCKHNALIREPQAIMYRLEMVETPVAMHRIEQYEAYRER